MNSPSNNSPKKRGRPAKGAEKKKTAAYVLSPEILERIETIAAGEGISRSQLVEQILRFAFRMNP